MPRFHSLPFALVALFLSGCGASPPEASHSTLLPTTVVAPAPPPFLPVLAMDEGQRAALLTMDLPTPPPFESACNEQAAQAFLIRESYMFHIDAPPDEAVARKRLHQAAIEYRARHYGTVPSLTDPSFNPKTAAENAMDVRFFGRGVRMHRRVVPALRCVEEAIQVRCANDPYEPRVLDGLRTRNTFHNNEISNHTFGIAIDINPNENSCCGCVPPLSEWPRCKVPGTAYERAKIPKCWIDTFERYGFYWLGHDVLEDTMHFEFLGDPAKILRNPAGKKP